MSLYRCYILNKNKKLPPVGYVVRDGKRVVVHVPPEKFDPRKYELIEIDRTW